MSQSVESYYQAAATEWGPGKVHVISQENPRKTVCGKWLEAMPGRDVQAQQASCASCRNTLVARREREVERQRWEQQYAAEQEARRRKETTWWQWYKTYLASPAWRAKSAAVLRCAGGMCEGCGVNRATQAHHTTYDHAGNEFLWELVVVCNHCHDQVHQHRDEGIA